jgi:hypothetical protein
LVGVTGIEPAAPCLQTKWAKTLTALSGVAYTDCQRVFRSSVVPNLSRNAFNFAALRHSRFTRLCDDEDARFSADRAETHRWLFGADSSFPKQTAKVGYPPFRISCCGLILPRSA